MFHVCRAAVQDLLFFKKYIRFSLSRNTSEAVMFPFPAFLRQSKSEGVIKSKETPVISNQKAGKLNCLVSQFHSFVTLDLVLHNQK